MYTDSDSDSFDRWPDGCWDKDHNFFFGSDSESDD